MAKPKVRDKPEPMTKTEFKMALKAMGTTPHKVAGDIGISQRQAYRYASGDTAITPAMAILIRMLLKRYRLNAKA